MDTKVYLNVYFFHRIGLIEAPSGERVCSSFPFLRLASPFASPL